MSWKTTSPNVYSWPPYGSLVTAAYDSPGDSPGRCPQFVSGQVIGARLIAQWNQEAEVWYFAGPVMLSIISEGVVREIPAIAWHPIPPLDGE